MFTTNLCRIYGRPTKNIHLINYAPLFDFSDHLHALCVEILLITVGDLTVMYLFGVPDIWCHIGRKMLFQKLYNSSVPGNILEVAFSYPIPSIQNIFWANVFFANRTRQDGFVFAIFLCAHVYVNSGGFVCITNNKMTRGGDWRSNGH